MAGLGFAAHLLGQGLFKFLNGQNAPSNINLNEQSASSNANLSEQRRLVLDKLERDYRFQFLKEKDTGDFEHECKFDDAPLNTHYDQFNDINNLGKFSENELYYHKESLLGKLEGGYPGNYCDREVTEMYIQSKYNPGKANLLLQFFNRRTIFCTDTSSNTHTLFL